MRTHTYQAPFRTRGSLRRRERGHVGAAALAGVFAIAALGYVTNLQFQAESRDSWISRAADTLVLQTKVASSAILACGSIYTRGDNGDPTSAADARRFPGTTALLADVRCPGAPSKSSFILKGRDGAFVSQLPTGFGPWTYSNSSAGLSFSVEANSPLAATAARLAERRLKGVASFSGSTLTVSVAYPNQPGDAATESTECGSPPAQPVRPSELEQQDQWYSDYAAWEVGIQAYQACLVWGTRGPAW